jgi:hypothetical protein
MSNRRGRPEIGAAPLVEEKRVVSRHISDSSKDRAQGLVLVAFVVLVQVAWASALIYLGVRFL